jgi:RNA polymerase sigma factor, sigma-70 family
MVNIASDCLGNTISAMEIYSSESEIWKAFLSGDEKAFSTLYYMYADVLFSYGHKIVNDREMIKDTIQELFIKLYHNRKNLNETEHVKFYLFKALRNRLISKLTLRTNLSLDADKELLFQIEITLQEEEEPDEMFSENQKEELSRAMKTLTSRQREAVYLRYIQEIPLEDIAQMLDMNYQSARNLIHRSIIKLRKELLIIAFLLLLS